MLYVCLIWSYICIEVCVWECMRSICFYVVCGIVLRCVVCQCGNIYTYRLHVWQMHYGVRVLHLQHRHVFSSYEEYVDWRGCFVRQARTCTALTRWHARTRTDVHGKALWWRKRVRLTDCFLPPPHRVLLLHGNQLSSLPDLVFDGLSALT